MAGAGYKLFATGDVLTAAQVNTYLMQQTVMVFASSAARTTALSGVLAEGMLSYLSDTNTLQYYDGAAWQNVSSPGDITAVTAGTGISGGGTSGDVTITNSMATAITTSGDLIQGTGAGTFARLGVGTNGQVLSSNGTSATWTTPATAGGMTLISTTTLSGASVTLSSIPQTYKSLVLYIRGYRPATDGQLLGMRYNGVTSNNYATNDLGVSVAGVSFAVSRIYASIEQDNGTDNNFSTVNIFDYTNTTTWKYSTTFTMSNSTTTPTSASYGSYYGAHNNTAAISSITLAPFSGNFTSGTVLLYGVA